MHAYICYIPCKRHPHHSHHTADVLLWSRSYIQGVAQARSNNILVDRVRYIYNTAHITIVGICWYIMHWICVWSGVSQNLLSDMRNNTGTIHIVLLDSMSRHHWNHRTRITAWKGLVFHIFAKQSPSCCRRRHNRSRQTENSIYILIGKPHRLCKIVFLA